MRVTHSNGIAVDVSRCQFSQLELCDLQSSNSVSGRGSLPPSTFFRRLILFCRYIRTSYEFKIGHCAVLTYCEPGVRCPISSSCCRMATSVHGFQDISAENSEVTEVESLCLACERNVSANLCITAECKQSQTKSGSPIRYDSHISIGDD